MENNPYAAPDSEVVLPGTTLRQRFYAVAPIKFFVLFFATFGFYQLFWHYQNWTLLKRARKSDEWPVMRGIFSIFFTHSLFREIDKELVMTHNTYSWNAELNATAIVVIMIADRIIGRLSATSDDFTVVDALVLLAIPLLSYFLFQAQKAANQACGDPQGRTNANFTIPNIVWIVLGGLVYLLVALGIFVSFFPE